MPGKTSSYSASVRCPACGSRQMSNSFRWGSDRTSSRHTSYSCGYKVTATVSPDGEVTVVGTGCRAQERMSR